MGVASDIAESWRRPRAVVRRHLALGQREDRALVFLMLGCALIGLSQWPRQMRATELGSDVPFDAGIGATILAWLFIMPLALYLIAAVSHIVARVAGGAGSWFTARMALFWAVLAAAPAWLFAGVVEGYLGREAIVSQIVSLIALAGFVVIWILGLIEAESKKEAA